jgi:hypothetical protein
LFGKWNTFFCELFKSFEFESLLTGYILQGLPGVVLSSSAAADTPTPKLRRRMPDSTSSPYFGLDRHLNQRPPSGRKRLLDDLNESGFPFLTSQIPHHPEPVANTSAQRNKRLSRVVSVEGTDMFGMSALKKTSPQREGNAEIIDLTSIAQRSDHSANSDDLVPTTHMCRIEN